MPRRTRGLKWSGPPSGAGWVKEETNVNADAIKPVMGHWEAKACRELHVSEWNSFKITVYLQSLRMYRRSSGPKQPWMYCFKKRYALASRPKPFRYQWPLTSPSWLVSTYLPFHCYTRLTQDTQEYLRRKRNEGILVAAPMLTDCYVHTGRVIKNHNWQRLALTVRGSVKSMKSMKLWTLITLFRTHSGSVP